MLKTILLYGFLLGILVFLLNFIEYFFWVRMHIFEIYAALIAFIFLGLGLWFGRKNSNSPLPQAKHRSTPLKMERAFESEENISQLGISKREYDVLLLMGEGMSNQEIADKLFVSTNTVKTHTSRLFEKLEVKNRTQAILKAKELGLTKYM